MSKLFFLILLLPLQLWGQDNAWQWSIYGHFTPISTVAPKEWKTFIDSYNTVTNPTQDAGKLTAYRTFAGGVRLKHNQFYYKLDLENIHNTTTATFANQEERHFHFMQRNASIIAGSMVDLIDDKLYWSLGLGMLLHDECILRATYAYGDGYESMGSEKDMNGTYGSAGYMGILFETGLTYQINAHFGFEGFFNFQSGNLMSSSTFDDYSYYKAMNNNGIQMMTFPANYNDYLTAPDIASYEGMRSRFRGMNLRIGMAYTL